MPELQFTPITDQLRCITNATGITYQPNLIHREISALRLELLEHILPAPAAPLSAQEIEIFKSKYGDQLSRFRHHIELALIELANFSDLDLQRMKLDLLKKQIDEETDDIRTLMKKHGWKNIVFGKLFSILGGIPIIGTVPKLINAVYKAISGDSSNIDRYPLAYAAGAQERLLNKIGRKLFRD